MSLVKAYSNMKKRGHKMSSGGMCEACGGDCKYSAGGEVKGVNKSDYDMPAHEIKNKYDKHNAGESKAGEHTRKMGESKGFEKDMAREEAIEKHHMTLGEMSRVKPKLQGLAHGGEVKGVHAQTGHGYSKAGALAEFSKELKDEGSDRTAEKYMNEAKSEHHEKLHELRTMPNPKLKGLAHGGKVKGFDMDAEETKSFMDKGEFTSEAEGGEVDNQLMDQCCGELLKAFETKNKKEILDSLKAIILSTKG